MIFVYSRWEEFCETLRQAQVLSVSAERLTREKPNAPYVVLKHDVETNVASALKMAQIENRYGLSGSYYVQAYLLDDPKNVAMLREIQEMGFEVSYHYDVLDGAKGDFEKALADFEKNKETFEKNGFPLTTVCQHGNPIVERRGYASNRDFFRNEEVQKRYPQLSDVMVDFKRKAFGSTDYVYFSDAGRKFKLIYDPINNDLVPSDDKDVPFDDLDALWEYVRSSLSGQNCIISVHPHRWQRSKVKYLIGVGTFKTVRAIAKTLTKIPFCKKLMSRYFYLAKKF